MHLINVSKSVLLTNRPGYSFGGSSVDRGSTGRRSIARTRRTITITPKRISNPIPKGCLKLPSPWAGASVYVLKKGKDGRVPCYRDLAMMLSPGMIPTEFMLTTMGKAVPPANSSWADCGIRLHKAINLGMAVALPEGSTFTRTSHGTKAASSAPV